MNGLKDSILTLNQNFVQHSNTITELLLALNRNTGAQGSTDNNPTEQTVSTVASKISEELNKRRLNELTIESKKKITEWKKVMNKRNQAFHSELRNRTLVDIYNKWLSKDTPFIPKKFRPTVTQNEPEDQVKIKQWISTQQMNGEMALMKKRADAQKQAYTKIDEDMKELLQQKYPGIIGENLLKLWTEECDKGQAKSEQIWIKKREWFENLENAENDTGTEDSKQPRKQNQNRQNNPPNRRNQNQLENKSFRSGSRGNSSRRQNNGFQNKPKPKGAQGANSNQPQERGRPRFRTIPNQRRMQSQSGSRKQRNWNSNRNNNPTNQEQRFLFQGRGNRFKRKNWNSVGKQRPPKQK